MSSGARAGLIAAAIAVGVAAFFVLGPAEEGDDAPPPSETVATETDSTTAPPPRQPSKPRYETVTLAGGKVEGGQREIEVDKGEIVRLEIRSDAADEIHLHGYDLTETVAPGRPARFRFEAGIEGVFEVEAHDLGHVVIAKLVVRP